MFIEDFSPIFDFLVLTNEQFGYTCTRGRDKIHISRPRTEFDRRASSFKGAQLYNTLCHLLFVRLRPSLCLNISVFPTACQLVSLYLLFVILVNFVLVILFCYCNFCFVLLL